MLSYAGYLFWHLRYCRPLVSRIGNEFLSIFHTDLTLVLANASLISYVDTYLGTNSFWLDSSVVFDSLALACTVHVLTRCNFSPLGHGGFLDNLLCSMRNSSD